MHHEHIGPLQYILRIPTLRHKTIVNIICSMKLNAIHSSYWHNHQSGWFSNHPADSPASQRPKARVSLLCHFDSQATTVCMFLNHASSCLTRLNKLKTCRVFGEQVSFWLEPHVKQVQHHGKQQWSVVVICGARFIWTSDSSVRVWLHTLEWVSPLGA